MHSQNRKSLKVRNLLKIDISLNGYHVPVGTPSEAIKGGVLLYISNELNFKPRPDLTIYQAKGAESIFVEIVNKNKSNNIVGVVYRYPSMCEDFNDNFLRNLIHKFHNENNKNIYIAGDFNFDLIKISDDQATADFFIYSHQIFFFLQYYYQLKLIVELIHL